MSYGHASYLRQAVLGRRLMADAAADEHQALRKPKRGDRVVCIYDGTEVGAVREVWPQSNADDLVRVNWDGRKVDPDWYSTAVLEREPAAPTSGTFREDGAA